MYGHGSLSTYQSCEAGTGMAEQGEGAGDICSPNTFKIIKS